MRLLLSIVDRWECAAGRHRIHTFPNWNWLCSMCGETVQASEMRSSRLCGGCDECQTDWNADLPDDWGVSEGA